jgi:hypothetical protein
VIAREPMANLSLYSQNKLVDWITGKANMPASATTYLALFNGDPSGAGSEVTLTICSARIAISSAMSSSTGGAGSSSNASDLTWTTSALAGATVSYVAAYDAVTAGNLLWYRSVTSNAVSAGNMVKILAGQLSVTASGDLSGYSKDYLVNWMTGKASFPSTTTRYYALYNGDPQGAGSEVTSTIRPAGRVAFTTLMSTASGGSSSDTTMIDFGNASGAATISYTGGYDASTAGNCICSHAITGGAQSITSGNPVRVPVSSQTVTAS